MFILVGPFIWFIQTNRALNEYWQSLGADPDHGGLTRCEQDPGVPRTSAGVLLQPPRRGRSGGADRADMGGPFWARKDEGGVVAALGASTDPARTRSPWRCREFEEELGSPVPGDGLRAAR